MHQLSKEYYSLFKSQEHFLFTNISIKPVLIVLTKIERTPYRLATQVNLFFCTVLQSELPVFQNKVQSFIIQTRFGDKVAA